MKRAILIHWSGCALCIVIAFLFKYLDLAIAVTYILYSAGLFWALKEKD